MAAAAASPLALPDGLVWRADRLAAPARRGLPTGWPELDAELPGGGWPPGALIELLADQPGIGEIGLLAPLLGRVPAERWIAWIAPPWLPYAPALQAAGVPLAQLLVVEAAEAPQAQWATRQALASGACHAVLAWPRRIDTAALRRLQLAAEASATPLFLFRPQGAAAQPSPAPLRLRLEADGAGLRVEILKRRGPALDGALRLARSGRGAPCSDLPEAGAAIPGNATRWAGCAHLQPAACS